MAGLDPVIFFSHAVRCQIEAEEDGRVKPGHDGGNSGCRDIRISQSTYLAGDSRNSAKYSSAVTRRLIIPSARACSLNTSIVARFRS